MLNLHIRYTNDHTKARKYNQIITNCFIMSLAKQSIKLKERPLKSGKRSLYLEIRENGRRHYEFLHLFIVPEITRADKIQNKETRATAEAVKAQRVIEAQNAANGFSLARFRGFAPLVDYINGLVERGALGVYHYPALLAHLKDFDPGARLKDINREWVLRFVEYLSKAQNFHTYAGGLAPGTQQTLLGRLSSVLSHARRSGLITHNPVFDLARCERPHREDVTRTYLTPSELRRFAEAPSGERKTDVKRAFLFCCFAGLRFGDCAALVWGNIRTFDNGRAQLEITQHKTARRLVVPLSENALRWLPNRGGARSSEKVFRLPTLGMCLKRLGWICAAAGIEKHVTFHMSRHTCATLLITYGVDIYTTSKILGHTSVKTTQIYARVIDANKRKAVDTIPSITEMKDL